MRNRSSSEDWVAGPSAESSGRGLGALRALALIGGVALIAAPLIASFVRHRRDRQRPSEPEIDNALKGTFPASDPPASHYYDIPVNRQ
ncbi:MAG TPA: hypothetical protein VIL28_03605 [Steroidobacteraceae bacterium]